VNAPRFYVIRSLPVLFVYVITYCPTLEKTQLVPLLRSGKTHSVLLVFLCIGALVCRILVWRSALCEDKMNTLFYTRTSVKTDKLLELVDVINVTSFLLQVGFILFYYKKLKCEHFRLLTYIEESFKSFSFLRVTPFYHHWIKIATLALRVKVFSVTTPT
jgi:hypothetical protein